jgi:hypothetical protein
MFHVGIKMSDNEKRLAEKALENNKKLKMRRHISREILKNPITI